MSVSQGLRFFRNRMLKLGIGVALFLVGFAVYNSYKYLCWPQAQGVVASIEPVCVYTKRESPRTVSHKLPNCDDSSEAAKLVADGYKLKWKEALVQITYRTEHGEEIHATLTPEWESATKLHQGGAIQIRYSPGAPDEAELVTGAEKILLVVMGFFLGALILACLLAILTYEGDKQTGSDV